VVNLDFFGFKSARNVGVHKMLASRLLLHWIVGALRCHFPYEPLHYLAFLFAFFPRSPSQRGFAVFGICGVFMLPAPSLR
jgi:hypothetical protein